MDKKFTSNDTPMSQLLDQTHHGALQLPDFQRGWVWDDNHIGSLLASVSLSYLIGAMTRCVPAMPESRGRDLGPSTSWTRTRFPLINNGVHPVPRCSRYPFRRPELSTPIWTAARLR